MRWAEVATPINPLGVAVADGAVCAVRFGGVPIEAAPLLTDVPADSADGPLGAAVAQLTAYFAGEPLDFDVPLASGRGSDFERAVWRCLSRIPYGEMWTYGQVAAEVGEPDAARAVGVACNHNPLPVIVPCHRVVGAGGKLVGFGGGLWRKKLLLELEARVVIERQFGV
jgi:methylated-DNA-[protein]-cysteine S-methyltransferase